MSKAGFKTVVVHKGALTVSQYEKLQYVANEHGKMSHDMLWFTLLQDLEQKSFDDMGIVPVVTIWHEGNGTPIVQD